MPDLYSEPERLEAGQPVLLDIQRDLLDRGKQAYAQVHKRVIMQAMCGSGKTWIASEQTRRAREKNRTVLHIVHRRRLVFQMLDTLQRFGIQASPIMDGCETWNSPVYCASRDTLLAMLKAGIDLPRCDLIIWDECHVAARELQKWYLRECPDSFWTGFTATPVRPDGKSMKPPWQSLVCMGSQDILRRLGRLCSVKVYNPDALGQRRRKGDKVKPVGDPIEHWKKYAKSLPTVVFAANVADSQAITAKYNAAGISAEHIDASTKDEEREAAFERSREGQTKVISNCGVLIEGIDLPWLVCCQILRGCNSLVLWIQACGRIMRAYPGKSHGIVLDHAGAAHEYGLPDSDYQWTLEDEKANVKKNKPPKERRPIACPACGFVFVGKPVCPECGKVMPRRKRKSIIETLKPGDGILTEFTGQQEERLRQDVLERLYQRLLYIAKAKGRDMRFVAAVFSKEAGVPPWQAGLETNLPYGSEWQLSAAEWLQRNKHV